MKVSIVFAVMVAAVLIPFFSVVSRAQVPFSERQFSAFDSKGKPVTIAEIVDSMAAADIVFLGEQHDDAVAHAVQFELFRRAVAEYSARRKVVLSMEMFERDVQTMIDEYLAGYITENHLMLSSRPWGNYKTDYRPLVELAKEKRLEVVAANAPRRYVNMVSRGGRSTLDSLSREVKKNWLPPLPYAEASEAYAKKFKALMGPSAEAQMGLDNILSSQSLWDASMAYWASRALKQNKGGLVIHLNGAFHTEGRLGTVEHLLKYRPGTRVIVVTIRTEDDFTSFRPDTHSGIGDFVILTDGKVPRSKR